MISTQIKLCLLITVITSFCCRKDEAPPTHTGIVFYPVQKGNYSFTGMLGFSVFDETLKMPYYNYDSSRFESILSYQFQTKEITNHKYVPESDSTNIGLLYGISSGNYVAVASDKTKSFILNGQENSPDKLVILDNDLKLLKQNFIGDTLANYGNIKPLGNGNYVFTYNYYHPPVYGTAMICFDENLNIKWRTKLTLSSFSGLCVSNNTIYILEKIFATDPYFNVYQYDLNGNLKNSSTSLPSTFISNMVESEKGVNVFSLYNTSVKRSMLSVTVFDNNAGSLKTKFLDTKSFSFIEPYSFDFSSNIVKVGTDYYFTVYIINYTSQDLKTMENKLVKINGNLEMEWVKTIDARRKAKDYGYLVYDGHTLVSVGKSIWNGMEGLSFIQTDLDGNIIK